MVKFSSSILVDCVSEVLILDESVWGINDRGVELLAVGLDVSTSGLVVPIEMLFPAGSGDGSKDVSRID